ncbi:MAG: hypothetical protein M3Z50_03245 [Actinomycetota bacterium]|nr:hypothetical protein [Actinomycetota bacterium]
MTSGPNYNEDPDTEGRAIPPYDGRQTSGDVGGQEESTKDGARTGGATGPVDDPEPKASDPSETERGQHASPADEQPASESTDTDLDPDMTGPSHEPGTGRAEDKS